jgi:O-antigen ligase
LNNLFIYLFLAFWPTLYIIGHFFIVAGVPHAMGITPLRTVSLTLLLNGLFNGLLNKRIEVDKTVVFFIIYLTTFTLNLVVFKPSAGYPSTFLFVADRYLIPVSIYFILINSGRDLNKTITVISILTGGIILAAAGLLEFTAGHNLIGPPGHWAEIESQGAIYRTNGPFHGGIGYAAIVLLYFIFAYYVFKKRWINRKFAFFCIVLFGIGATVNYSRAVWIAFAVTLMIILSGTSIKKLLLEFYAFIGILLLGFLFFDNLFATRLYTERIGDMTNAFGRLNQYVECLGIWIRHPVLGIGHERYKDSHYYFIHNSYLKVLVEYGIFSFISYTCFVFSTVFANLKSCLPRQDHDARKILVAVAFTVFFVPNTIDVLHYSEFLITLFIITFSVKNFPHQSNHNETQSANQPN